MAELYEKESRFKNHKCAENEVNWIDYNNIIIACLKRIGKI